MPELFPDALPLLPLILPPLPEVGALDGVVDGASLGASEGASEGPSVLLDFMLMLLLPDEERDMLDLPEEASAPLDARKITRTNNNEEGLKFMQIYVVCFVAEIVSFLAKPPLGNLMCA